MKQIISRRNFLKLTAGSAATAAGVSLLPRLTGRNVLQPTLAESVRAQGAPPDMSFVSTDGWISLPTTPALPPFHPDNYAPEAVPGVDLTTYMFGFRNVTGLDETQIQNQKMKAQHSAPLFWTQQDVPFRVNMRNLGLAGRPDLSDPHTIHWHGFRNQIPFFDGEPSGSVSVPITSEFTYHYIARKPGTYMYHCHVEDVEHVHLGMTGMVFVRPAQDGNTALYPSGKYAYNCGDGSTGYDREYSMFLSEVWAEAHWSFSHVQLPEWSDYHLDFAMLNGRVYPDTLAPSGSIDIANPIVDASGDLIPTPGFEHLKYQPISSLVECNAGERVLLRFANLGFKEASMTLPGIKMNIVGKDATHLRGRDNTDISYMTSTFSIGAGESFDAIFEAPAHSGGTGPDVYLLYNRTYKASSNLSGSHGGQMTEVRVYPAGTIATQTLPNT